MMHFYVFIYREGKNWKGIPIYDRTCGTLEEAKARLKDHKGFISIDSVPKDFWY